MLRHGSLTTVLMVTSFLILSGCASNNKKAELRDKVVQQSGFMCDFINGDQHKLIEIELNVLMAKRCDTEKPYSVTNYKTSAEVNGLLYCCRIKEQAPAKSSVALPPPPTSPATSPAVSASPTTNSKSADAKKSSTASSANSTVKPTNTAPKKPADKASDVELDIEIEPGQ